MTTDLTAEEIASLKEWSIHFPRNSYPDPSTIGRLIDQLERLKEANRPWVKCTDRMPNLKGAWVLVYADGAVNCAWWWDGRWGDPMPFNIDPEQITHWMPIPELPPAPEAAS